MGTTASGEEETAMGDGSKPRKAISFFGVPALFIGLTKGPPEQEPARSPTSPLDGKAFRSPRSPPALDRATLGLADLLLLQGSEPKAAKLPVSAPPLRTPTAEVNSAPRTPIELSEDYTCVISRRGQNPGTTHIFGDRVLGNPAGDGGGGRRWPEWTVACPEEEEPPAPADFLKACLLCKKDLEGRDVYIYR